MDTLLEKMNNKETNNTILLKKEDNYSFEKSRSYKSF